MDPIAREELINGHRAEFRADPGGGYVVQFPYLPGCVTEGDTIEEARAAAAEALAVYLLAHAR